MCDGVITGEVPAAEATERELGLLMTSSDAQKEVVA